MRGHGRRKAIRIDELQGRLDIGGQHEPAHIVVDAVRLDTRSHRGLSDPTHAHRPDLTMLGARQKAWLKERMQQSDADMFFVVSQVSFMVPHTGGTPNAGEVDDFVRFWTAAPGVDQVRVKEDETNLIRPSAGHAPSDWRHPCHYLWRGPLYVKHNGDVYPCCQSYMLGGRPVGRIGEAPLETIWNSGEMERMRRLHVEGRAGEIDICARCCTTIPHPALVLGSLLLHGRTVRRLLPAVERLVYLSKLPRKLLRPPKA